MSRLSRFELFRSDELAIVHVMNRTVRRCFLMGHDAHTGRNYDYRKDWIEQRMEYLAKHFGIDVLTYSILSDHFHLVLRQRPDVVKSWSDTEVAQRWLMICPKRKNKDGSPKEPTEPQLKAIRNNPAKLKEIRSRLSDISWWMRLMCQNIAQRINRDDQEKGKVWQNRYHAVRLLDEASLLACAAYVDLNPIRAAMAQNLEQSDFTSIQRRIQAIKEDLEAECLGSLDSRMVKLSDPVAPTAPEVALSASQVRKKPDRALAPVHLDELRDTLQVMPSSTGDRCSDRGFLNMSAADYVELLDWTARLVVPGKRGSTPMDAPPVFERLNLGLSVGAWTELVSNFRKLFSHVAGRPHIVEAHRSLSRKQRFHLPDQARELLSV